MKELPSVSFPGAQSMTVEEFTLSTWVPGHETGQYFGRSRTSTAADNGFSLEAQHRAPHNYQTITKQMRLTWRWHLIGRALRGTCVWVLMGSASNRSDYFAFLAFSALYFAHRAFVAFEILARPVADIVRLRFML